MSDKPGDVKAIGAHVITPRIVLETIYNEIAVTSEIYVVTFHLDGSHRVYASGDMERLAYAALALQWLGFHYINNRVRDE